jgi:superfamily II DNA or RNA helicase
MNVLRLENINSYLLTADLDIKAKLWNAMRFRKENFYHNQAYRQGRWDGFVEFFHKTRGRFLTGLRPEIEYALKNKFKIPYTIDDKTQDFKFNYHDVDNQFLNRWLPEEEHITLHDYQADLINQAIKYKRGIIKSPTGSGKTFIFIGIMRAIPPGTPTLILTDTVGLTEQNYDCLVQCGFKDVGILHGKKKKPNVITCSTVQSVKKLEKLFKHIRVVIVDEVHACMSPVPIKVYRKLKWAPIRLGISATPYSDKESKFKVKGHFGPVLKTRATESGELTTKELQERGILSGSECVFYEVNEPQIPYDIFQDAVKYGIADNTHFHSMVQKLVKKLKGRTLILVERLDQGDALAAMIPGSYWIQGKDKLDVKKEILQKLKTSDNVVAIISQKIISKGLDVKIHNLVNAAGGKAAHSVIQRMGRGLRTADDKEVLRYFDFLFNINDYLRDHSEKRIRTLQKEGHPISIKENLI